MRKALPITLIFLLLMLSMTHVATAQKKPQKSIITNRTTETLYVVYSSKFGAAGPVPAGYRTRGWKEISPGQAKNFWAYDPHAIYFQIWKGNHAIKPQRATNTFAFWIHPSTDTDFDVVTQQAINASISRDQLIYSSHATGLLTQSDGFMRRENRSRITVTNEWVPVTRGGVGERDTDPAVDIPDSALRNGIADTLKLLANTPITQRNMATLTTLWASGASIRDLTGLEFAVNLEALDLADNGITDVSPLANLQNLEELDLSDNPITDPTPLIGLRNGGTKITGVTFDDANPRDRPVPTGGAFDLRVDIPDSIFRLGITNVLGLAENAPITRGHLTTLTSLVVSGVSATDITGLEFAVNLEVLDLSHNALSDISPLAKLGNLTELNLSDNVISDVSPLENLKKLRLLNLSDNIIFDVSPLANLKNLTGLNLHNNGITNVSPLANSRHLKGLVLTENPITDETPLDGLRNGGTEVTILIYDDELLSSIGLWCATPEPPPSVAPIPGALGAAGERKHFWRKEDTVYNEPSLGGDTVLTVRFMNGTPLQKDKVEHFAPLWAEDAALRFIFTSENRPSDIRVKFEKEGYRSHSVLGTTANEPWNKGEATLVLGAGYGRKNPNYDENHRFNDFNPKLPPSGTIIHEFGHALGLIHEHSNPSATLQDIFDTETIKRWVTQETSAETA